MTERKSLESEREEEERIDRLRLTAFKSNDASDRQAYFDAASKWFQDRHYRRLAAQEQKPVAWIDFADNGNVRLWTSEKRRFDAETALGRKMTPVYLSPPPAAGWDQAIEAAAQIAVRYCVSPQCVSDIRALTKSPVVNDYLTTRLEDEQLDTPVKLTVVSWEGRIHCAYINNHRIAGGKPWAGGTTEKEWSTSLREVIRALPDLQKALGFDYLGRSALRHNAPLDSGAGKSDDATGLIERDIAAQSALARIRKARDGGAS